MVLCFRAQDLELLAVSESSLKEQVSTQTLQIEKLQAETLVGGGWGYHDFLPALR